MIPSIETLLPVAAVIAVVLLLRVVARKASRSRSGRRSLKHRGRPTLDPVTTDEPAAVPDGPERQPLDHLERVRTAPMEVQPVLNGSERKLWRIVQELVDEVGLASSTAVFAQVGLAEMINAGTRYTKGGAYIAIAERRVDLLVVDVRTRPRLAIEFDGPQHGRAKQKRSDQVKDVALARVGIRLLRIDYRSDDRAVRVLVKRELESVFASEIQG